jgi:hypothetical protein
MVAFLLVVILLAILFPRFVAGAIGCILWLLFVAAFFGLLYWLLTSFADLSPAKAAIGAAILTAASIWDSY